MGRKKLDMEYIKSKNARSRTFCNRKHGLLKKAGELSVLCNVDVALIIFGPNDPEKTYVWPQQPHQLNKVLQRYQSTTQEERQKRASNLVSNSAASFSGNSNFKMPTHNNDGIDGLSVDQLMELMNSLDSKLGVVNERIYMAKKNRQNSSCITEEQGMNMDMIMNPIPFGYNFQCDDQQVVYDNQDQMMMQMYGGNPMINANTDDYTGLLGMGFGIEDNHQSYLVGNDNNGVWNPTPLTCSYQLQPQFQQPF